MFRMLSRWTGRRTVIKHILRRQAAYAVKFFVLFGGAVLTGGCSTNPATGEQQFTALMPAQQERQIGAQEHQKIVQQYGIYEDQGLQAYLQQVGQRVTQKTERPDVRYSFYLLDTPMVNAFALPGGYIYMTRGLMALANSEAELASVLAHETGHITARHSAERYSRGVVTLLGAAVLSTAIGDSNVSDALGLGTDLYMKSYSRGQENEADMLGTRYLSRAGYDARAMADFLRNMQADGVLEARLQGQDEGGGLADYMSTHPATQERVTRSVAEAAKYPPGGSVGREDYLRRISGMIYGESAAQGFVRGRTFYHTELGFQFTVPPGFTLMNQPRQVIATSKNGGLIVFDFVANPGGLPAQEFMRRELLKDRPAEVEPIEINGLRGATTSFTGSAGGQSLVIRLIAVPWGQERIARFQVAYPPSYSSAGIEALRASTYSFRTMSAADKAKIRPHKLVAVTARPGDTVASMGARMPFEDYAVERFRVLNGLRPGEEVVTGRLYKTITE